MKRLILVVLATGLLAACAEFRDSGPWTARDMFDNLEKHAK